MFSLSPYLRLMRLHQPVGIWLLFWPCAWGLALASPQEIPWRYFLLFAAGAVIMRSTGCVINDLADMKFDREVDRTRNRPLASGEVSPRQALVLALSLLVLALMILLYLPWQLLPLAIVALPLVAIYPFMKRYTWWPQLFLGLTFNWGALMGWAAIRGEVEPSALLLYLGGIFWTLGYDTIYAHQDIADDARIGIKSTARLLGARTRPVVAVFYISSVLCIAAAGFAASATYSYYISLLLLLAHFGWQLFSLQFTNPASCLRIFQSNVHAGALPILGTYLPLIFDRAVAY